MPARKVATLLHASIKFAKNTHTEEITLNYFGSPSNERETVPLAEIMITTSDGGTFKTFSHDPGAKLQNPWAPCRSHGPNLKQPQAMRSRVDAHTPLAVETGSLHTLHVHWRLCAAGTKISQRPNWEHKS